MALAPRVLSISSDMSVFETRNRVLSSAGFAVVGCFRGEGAFEAFSGESIDAVVMGDSVPANMRVTWIQRFRALRPAVPIVVICSAGESAADVREADAALGALDGPERLINVLSSLVRIGPQSTGHVRDRKASGMS